VIADFEDRVMAAALRGEQLHLPVLAGELLPLLLYADDMALLATSAAGLLRQLQFLEEYCVERGLAGGNGLKYSSALPFHPTPRRV
jgi:hypothetical protein